MSFALPALVVFVLILPGFLFRSRYKLSERTSLDYAPFGKAVSDSLIWAAVLHGVWLMVAATFLGQTLDIGILLGLLSSHPPQQAAAISAVTVRADRVADYLGSLYGGAVLVPLVMRYVISRFRLDRIGSRVGTFCRYTEAPWYYLLTGADFARSELPDYIQSRRRLRSTSSPSSTGVC